MAPHQERVVAEKDELDEKIGKLSGFIGSSIFNGLAHAERERLHTQLDFMRGYSQVLMWRISAFESASKT